MKKHILLILLAFISLNSLAQKTPKKEPRLIADETTISDGEKSFSVQTCNEFFQKTLFEQADFRRILILPKRDRMGEYLLYTFTFDLEEKEKVVVLLSSLNKK